jgi:hypothetical protein
VPTWQDPRQAAVKKKKKKKNKKIKTTEVG